MKVTIDSSDPLEQALKVLGSLYGVQLSVASSNGGGEAEAPSAPAEEQTAPSASGRRRGRKSAAEGTSSRRSGRKSASKRPSLDMGAVRTWARESGYEVSDRGRVPNAVVSAYQESQSAS